MLVQSLVTALSLAVAPNADTQTSPTAVLPSRLVEAYKRNEVAADGLYRGRRIDVTGQVARIRKGLADEIWVALETPGAFGGVECSFDARWTLIVADLVPGQLVSIRALVQGQALTTIRLTDSIMLWVGAPPTGRSSQPTLRARSEADVLAASFESCVGALFDRDIEETVPEIVEQVLKATVAGTPNPAQRSAAEEAGRRSVESERASERYRSFMARAAVMKTAGAAELGRLGVPGVPCEHPALRLAWICKRTEKSRDREPECASEEMQLVAARYSALLKQLPAERTRK